MSKYEVESDSTLYLSYPGDFASTLYKFSLTPGFYTSIYIFAYNEKARGGCQCYMMNPNKALDYRLYLEPRFMRWTYDRMNWVLQNIQIDEENVFYLDMYHVKQADVVLFGYYATREAHD